MVFGVSKYAFGDVEKLTRTAAKSPNKRNVPIRKSILREKRERERRERRGPAGEKREV